MALPYEVHRFLEGFSLGRDAASDDMVFNEGPDGPDRSRTRVDHLEVKGLKVPRFVNEFWTSRQRQASSIHEISYRACFKPQLPAFFIDLLTEKGDVVYDPFSGRGTTAIEAGLKGRNVIANDINPLSRLMSYPRFFVPKLPELEERLGTIPFKERGRAGMDLSMFYDGRTISELESLREHLAQRKREGTEDELDRWIRMVATNRLTGHSKGFFSVYTLPPNQAVTQQSQRKINVKRGQVPEYRDVRKLIMKKTRDLTKDMGPLECRGLRRVGEKGLFLDLDARRTSPIPDGSVRLIVTSPPFLDIVQYGTDNWLRCWFNSIDMKEVSSRLTMLKDLDDWTGFMRECFIEFFRVVAPGGHVAFEVGEVRKGSLRLDEHIVPIGSDAGFEPLAVVVNQQEFTKTSNIWGVNNMKRGTNTNRIVLFKKP
ncbi:MAG: site-specific DNA-methyltransferase [Candidatus Thermoplasmatota archaeon]|jgi:DNA modification methylase|nr:site-specific DNA-methyltransferase [Candidatus Thermoplasmatota archaeon]